MKIGLKWRKYTQYMDTNQKVNERELIKNTIKLQQTAKTMKKRR